MNHITSGRTLQQFVISVKTLSGKKCSQEDNLQKEGKKRINIAILKKLDSVKDNKVI